MVSCAGLDLMKRAATPLADGLTRHHALVIATSAKGEMEIPAATPPERRPYEARKGREDARAAAFDALYVREVIAAPSTAGEPARPRVNEPDVLLLLNHPRVVPRVELMFALSIAPTV